MVLDDEQIWYENHQKRSEAFLRDLVVLQKKHKCLVDPDSILYIVYEDPYMPDILFQICPLIVDEYLVTTPKLKED